jgi:hypothetical protein
MAPLVAVSGVIAPLKPRGHIEGHTDAHVPVGEGGNVEQPADFGGREEAVPLPAARERVERRRERSNAEKSKRQFP